VAAAATTDPRGGSTRLMVSGLGSLARNGTVALGRGGREWRDDHERSRRPLPVLPSAFKGFRFPPEVIVLAVRWYFRFGLS
jgi:IS6 family transposase